MMAIRKVAPRVGAWIETAYSAQEYHSGPESHPVWVRGLKLQRQRHIILSLIVAPRVGAWIETTGDNYCFGLEQLRRTPCGCVD